MTTILVTGASGFVGKRLVIDLLQQGHTVYALCRIKGVPLFLTAPPRLHYIWGDLRNEAILANLPEEIEVAYYLVHSMSETAKQLIDVERSIAETFVKAIQNTKTRQIIYLGGMIEDETRLSSHLKSRLEVETVLRKSGIPYTVLRASIIIGAGSASFEIIRDLCEKLPVMVAPKWIHSLCQPIAIGDVLFYLSHVLLREACMNKVFEIGGPKVLTFKEVLLEYSKFRHLKRWILEVPVLTPRLSSYWLVLITSVRYSICSYLVESMKSNTIVRDDALSDLLPHTKLTYQQALALAFQKIEQNEVVSSWMDAWDLDERNPSIDDFIQVPNEGCLKDLQKVPLHDSKAAVIDRIWRLGGQNGYYTCNWAWRLRGWLDQMIGGVGLNRGRRHPFELYVGDAIDFWRVIFADKDRGHLILYAGMKLPGEAWLQFQIEEDNPQATLVQTATFRPKGLLGRLYWYALFPFHLLIFKRMARALAGAKY